MRVAAAALGRCGRIYQVSEPGQPGVLLHCAVWSQKEGQCVVKMNREAGLIRRTLHAAEHNSVLRRLIGHNSVLRRLIGKLRTLIVHEHILLLRKVVSTAKNDPDFEVIEHTDRVEEIRKVYRKLGRSELEKKRIESRIQNGLRFFELRYEGETAAITWIVPPGNRFIDEVALQFPVAQNAAWVRDIEVLPHVRGRRIFGSLLNAILSTCLPETRELWSDVEVENRASVRAHLNYGFKTLGDIQAIHVCEVFMFRLKVPVPRSQLNGFKADKRALVTGEEYRLYKERYLA